MKVIQSGAVFINGGLLSLPGWVFDLEGAPLPQYRQLLACVLLHVAAAHGIHLGAAPTPAPVEPDAVPIDVERLTLDVITMARWSPQQ